MAQLTGEYPRPIARPVWLTARARNAMHRPVFIGAVGVATFAAALVALLLAPHQVKHIGQSTQLPVDARPDTTPFATALVQARTRLATADASLNNARTHAAAVVTQPVDTLGPLLIKQRDSLSAAVSDLGALLTRVESAPVTASYRALAESPQLNAIPRVKTLLDSLTEVERDRESYGTTGVADPVYVALTSRATEIGRAIEGLGQERREFLRDQIAKLNAPTVRQTVAESPAADTTAWIAERDSAQSLVAEATTSLTQARAKVKEYDRQLADAQEQAKLAAPPVALLGAALVFGVALGFGAAFVGEIRHPRVADEHELERVTGARVLATVKPRPRSPDRQRRSADKAAPPYFDPGADGYQLTYLHVARAGASRLMLTITGDDTGIAAVVAANVAAIAADEARTTVIVDTDVRQSPVAAALHEAPSPGLAEILDQRTDWSQATVQATVGRDRTIDLVPGGASGAAPSVNDITALFQRDAARLARYYEAIIVVATMEQTAAGLPGALPINDTILCARVGYTGLAYLQQALDAVRAAGGNPLGVVLWDAPPPAFSTAERSSAAPRRPRARVSETGALTSAS